MLVLLAGAPAQAQDDATLARTLFEAGGSAFVAKRYVESALHFEAAASKKPHASAHLMAARSWEAADRPERAADAFARALDAPGLTPDNRASAQTRLDQLERALGVVVVSAGQPTRVQLDGLTEATTPARLHAVPGTHTLIVHGSDGTLSRHTVTLQTGVATTFDADAAVVPPVPVIPALAPAELPAPVVATPAPPPMAAPPARIAWSLRTKVGMGVMAAGALTLASSAYFGLEALQTHDGYIESPTQAELDRGPRLVRWTNITLAAGALLGAAGAALVWWPARSSETQVAVAVAPGEVAVRGRF